MAPQCLARRGWVRFPISLLQQVNEGRRVALLQLKPGLPRWSTARDCGSRNNGFESRPWYLIGAEKWH